MMECLEYRQNDGFVRLEMDVPIEVSEVESLIANAEGFQEVACWSIGSEELGFFVDQFTTLAEPKNWKSVFFVNYGSHSWSAIFVKTMADEMAFVLQYLAPLIGPFSICTQDE